jgi:hypothetical protein
MANALLLMVVILIIIFYTETNSLKEATLHLGIETEFKEGVQV